MNLLSQSIAIGPLGLSLGQLLIVFALGVAHITGLLLGRHQRLGIGDTLSMPVLAEAQREETDITFVFLNQGEDPAQVRRFLNHESLTLDNLLLDAQLAFGDRVGARAMPTTLFYDADGRLLDTHFGELYRATLNRALERLR